MWFKTGGSVAPASGIANYFELRAMGSSADVETPPEDTILTKEGFKMPSVEELLDALNHLEGMTDEEKEELRKTLTVNQEFASRITESSEEILSAGTPSSQLLTLLILLSIVALIFGKMKIHIYRTF